MIISPVEAWWYDAPKHCRHDMLNIIEKINEFIRKNVGQFYFLISWQYYVDTFENLIYFFTYYLY